jgi:AcrB/AcrD/AcrF family
VRGEPALKGVGNVRVAGDYPRQFYVEPDPGKLFAMRLTMLDVNNAVAAGNVSMPGGSARTRQARERIMRTDAMTPFTETWFASGQRLGYYARTRTIDPAVSLKVFVRVDGDVKHAVTFLPGYPDGSIGWARIVPYLPDAATMPKLFVEYVGMGDSDKPRDYAYSTAERTWVRGHCPVSARPLVELLGTEIRLELPVDSKQHSPYVDHADTGRGCALLGHAATHRELKRAPTNH